MVGPAAVWHGQTRCNVARIASPSLMLIGTVQLSHSDHSDPQMLSSRYTYIAVIHQRERETETERQRDTQNDRDRERQRDEETKR